MTGDEAITQAIAESTERAWFVVEAAAGLNDLELTPYIREVLDLGISAGIAGAMATINARLPDA